MKTTYLIIVLNVLVYAAMMATSHEVGEFSTRTLIDFGALYVPLVREGQWWRIPTKSPVQPIDGFTVAAYEDDEEVHALCSSYESADDEGRRLIRLVAELSVLSARKPF